MTCPRARPYRNHCNRCNRIFLGGVGTVNLDEIYIPTELPDDVVAALKPIDAITMLCDELSTISERPPTEHLADLELLARSALANKAGVSRAWLRARLPEFVSGAQAQARNAAIEAAIASGATAQSLALWGKVATGVTYAPSPGWLVDEYPTGSGLYRLLHIEATGVVPVGPAVYPCSTDEHGDVRLGGVDRWGRPLDTEIILADLDRPAVADRLLSEVGAWMARPDLWCDWTRDVLAANDYLRVPDPEPTTMDWDELADALRDIIAAAHGAQKIIGGHRVSPVPVSVVESALGRKVPASERRRWAERGLVVRGPDHRFAGLARVTRGEPPVRCFLLVHDAFDPAAHEHEAAAQ